MDYQKSVGARIGEAHTQAPEGEMQRGLRRLHEFNGRLSELRNKASRLSDHIVGPVPESASKLGGALSASASMGSAMNEAIDIAHDICNALDEKLQNCLQSVGG